MRNTAEARVNFFARACDFDQAELVLDGEVLAEAAGAFDDAEGAFACGDADGVTGGGQVLHRGRGRGWGRGRAGRMCPARCYTPPPRDASSESAGFFGFVFVVAVNPLLVTGYGRARFSWYSLEYRAYCAV